jgi:hypothetical protein
LAPTTTPIPTTTPTPTTTSATTSSSTTELLDLLDGLISYWKLDETSTTTGEPTTTLTTTPAPTTTPVGTTTPHSTTSTTTTTEEPGDYQNLLLWSEELDRIAGSPWDTSNVTIAANLANDLNGEATLDRATFSWNTNDWRQTVTVSASTDYVFSFEAKRGTATAAAYAIYNLSGFSWIVATTSYYDDINADTPVRISVPFTTPVGCTSVWCCVLRDANATSGNMYAGRAQLRLASYPEGYIKTEDTAIP